MDENKKETIYEIEKMADIKAAREEAREEITFDNSGNMVFHNRAFERNHKRLWRAVTEGRQSIRFYTQQSGMEKPKTNKKSKKRERQNRRIGRLLNGNA